MNYIIKLLFILCIFTQAFGQTPKDSYIIELKYLDAQNVADVLNAVLQLKESDHIIISAVQLETANNLIIIASNDDYVRIKELIEQLDVPLPNVEVQEMNRLSLVRGE